MMHEVTYTFEGQVYRFFMCQSHLYIVDMSIGDTRVAPIETTEECSECQMMQAAYESDKRAEMRNEAFLAGMDGPPAHISIGG